MGCWPGGDNAVRTLISQIPTTKAGPHTPASPTLAFTGLQPLSGPVPTHIQAMEPRVVEGSQEGHAIRDLEASLPQLHKVVLYL